MVEQNAVGDIVVTDPAAMRALAHGARLAVLDAVRRQGPVTAEELGVADEVRLHLGELERHGFVEQNEGRWTAVGKGLVFRIPEDPEGEAAARELTDVMLLRYVDLPRIWAEQQSPRLPVEWARASGLVNARVTMTSDELEGLQERLEELLEPLINREQPPDGARPVRVLAYFLPDATS
jgi:hypothetical protein